MFNSFTDLFECIFEEQHQQLKNWEMGAVFKSSQVYTHKKSQELCKFIQVTEIKRVRQTCYKIYLYLQITEIMRNCQCHSEKCEGKSVQKKLLLLKKKVITFVIKQFHQSALCW